MKIFKFLALTLAVVLGFSSCNPKENHDHSSDLAGTWTCLTADFAEAMVINEDGSVVSTILVDGNYLENMKGNIVVENDIVTLSFEDGTKVEGHFDIIPGMAFSIYNEDGGRMTFNYCEEDLSEEIIGMWVCNDGLTDGITIMSYSNNGKSTITTATALGTDDPLLNRESDYEVIGDLVFTKLPTANSADGKLNYTVAHMTYTPNGTSAGDIMTHKMYTPSANGLKESVISFLRIKQYLDLTGKTYDYSSAYVSNAKGKDEDFTMLGHTFNMANINAGNFDMMFRSELFCVDLNTNTITQHFLPANGQDVAIEIPITVEGNKVTLDLSAENPAYRKVDMYMFQDQDNTQLHMYMHTNDFINYFANMELYNLLASGEITPDNTAAIEKVYADMEARIESINVSFVFKVRK